VRRKTSKPYALRYLRHATRNTQHELLEQHLEVRPVVAAGEPAQAALDGAQRLLADPERQQRADHQAERAAERCTEGEQDIARMFAAFHDQVLYWTITTGVALLQRRSIR